MNKPPFEVVYQQNYQRILYHCLRMTRDMSSAEDFTQVTFLKAFKYWDRFRGDSAVSSWLTRIAINEFLMSKRKAAVRLETQLELDEDGEPLQMYFAAPDVVVESTPERLLVHRALSKLQKTAPRQELVFELHHLHGYEHKEIAAMMGIKVGTCKSQCSKAIASMKQYLTI